jgi:Tol biopolymer transport system component/predicted Ser/Thr protein kinase
MPLDPGTNLGPYEILSLLGVGGMGEVYRARDPRLGRDVAIKVSAQKFNERFEREAKVVASLNHPNICALYDVGPNYIVMELVEGEAPKGPMPLEEALEVCRQIAAALEAAHEKGVVHRDLKPANIKVTPTGTVKVLDFGLAKINSLNPTSGSNPEESPTISMHATQAGMILGTAGYMAPEQAKGKTADKRADIWAFGVILHELLTGQRLFMGETVTDTLAAVVLTQPKLEDVPIQVRRLLKRCLEKHPQRRLRDIGDAMALVEEAPPPSSAPVIAPASPSLMGKLGWGVASLAVIAAAALAFVHFRETPPVTETVRFKAALPENVNFTNNGISALSPDGRKLAFSAVGSDGVPRVWIRALDSLVAQPLPGSETIQNLATLFWSPDSRFVAFQGDGKLKKIDAAGGPALALCDAPNQIAGGSWNRDGVILFAMDNRILRVSAAGGTPSPVISAPPQGQGGQGFPTFLPDGRHFLYYRASSKAELKGTFVGALDVKPEQQSAQRLMADDNQPVYVPSSDTGAGYILFLRQGTVLAQPFDAKRLQLAGEPVPVAEQVASIQSLGHYSASENGALAYRTGTVQGLDLQLSWFDREGKATLTPVEPSRSSTLKVSPDGKRAATIRIDPQTNNVDIWVLDLATGAGSRFTFDPATDGNPVWSPDGSQIAWQSERGGFWGIYRKASNGSGNDELLYKSDTFKAGNLTDWSRDGRFILFQATANPQTKSDIYALPMGPGAAVDRQPIPVIQTAASELGGYLSPDGRWIAYLADESGRQEVYVQAFNPGLKAGASPVSGKWMVSKGSMGMARWRNDGKELVFIGGDGGVMSVDVTTDPVFHASAPKLLFQLPRSVLALSSLPGAIIDATRDLRRFLVTVPAQSNARPEFTVVLNWQAALKH